MNNGKIGSLSTEDIQYIQTQYQNRLNTGMSTKKTGVVICLDVLGWKNHTRPNQIENLTNLTASLESEILQDTLRTTDNKENNDIAIINLSDTIFIFISDSSPYFFVNVFKALAKFVNNAFNYSFAFRGAISYGEYTHNKTKNIFTGEAVYEAATYCESTEWAGIIITDSLAKELLKENDYATLEKINLIRYEAIPYKEEFLKKHSKCHGFLALNPNRIAIGPLDEYMITENLIDKYTRYFSDGTGNIPNHLKEKYQNTIDFIDFISKFSKLSQDS